MHYVYNIIGTSISFMLMYMHHELIEHIRDILDHHAFT